MKYEENQYDIGRRGCALMSSLLKANWDRRADRQAQVSIGMHAHPKMGRAGDSRNSEQY